MFKVNVALFAAHNYLSPVSSECMVEEARHEFTSPIARAEKESLRTPTETMLSAPLPTLVVTDETTNITLPPIGKRILAI